MNCTVRCVYKLFQFILQNLLSPFWIIILKFFKQIQLITPRSHRGATLRRSSRSSTIWKRLGSGRIGADRRLNRAIWQIVVFITTLLRCHYVKHAADTLLLRCYADRCRPEAAFTAFTLRCRYDIQDPTTTLRRPRWLYDDIATVVPIILRLYYASSTILAMMYICLRLETYFSLISKLQTWTEVLMLIWFIWLYFSKNKC